MTPRSSLKDQTMVQELGLTQKGGGVLAKIKDEVLMMNRFAQVKIHKDGLKISVFYKAFIIIKVDVIVLKYVLGLILVVYM